jgi:hypothetical protein
VPKAKPVLTVSARWRRASQIENVVLRHSKEPTNRRSSTTEHPLIIIVVIVFFMCGSVQTAISWVA